MEILVVVRAALQDRKAHHRIPFVQETNVRLVNDGRDRVRARREKLRGQGHFGDVAARLQSTICQRALLRGSREKDQRAIPVVDVECDLELADRSLEHVFQPHGERLGYRQGLIRKAARRDQGETGEARLLVALFEHDIPGVAVFT